MTNDTLARARAAVARIVAVREAGYLRAPRAWDEVTAPGIELDATPVLVRLAEAVGRLAVGKSDGWGERPWWGHYDDGFYPACQGCGELTDADFDKIDHAPDCPAVAVDAALAALAALEQEDHDA